jgi:hypothetical protein
VAGHCSPKSSIASDPMGFTLGILRPPPSPNG